MRNKEYQLNFFIVLMHSSIMDVMISSQESTSFISPIVSPRQMTPVPSTSPFSKNILQAVEPATYSLMSSNLHLFASLSKTIWATGL